jgi:transcriptional regulator with XRE-family HTH domain
MYSKQSRAARGLLKWSQRQLADVSGVGLSTVAEFENDKREPWPDNLAAIRAALEKAGVIFESDGKFVGVKMKKRTKGK